MFKKDITGQKFNRLTAVRFSHRNEKLYYYWLFRCDCGVEKVLRACSVISLKTKSCGCLHKEKARINGLMTKHGLTNTQEYKIWQGIKKRCYKPKCKEYKYYGGRGISVCDRWKNSFENFYKDMGQRPSKEYSVDRIDNNGNYCKENCRWAIIKEQNKNKRTTKKYKHNGVNLTIRDWADLKQLNYNTLKARITILKWDLKRALEER